MTAASAGRGDEKDDVGMGNSINAGSQAAFVEALQLRPVTIEDLAMVRYIHAAAFRLMAASCYPDEEIAAFVAYVHTAAYGDAICGENMLAGLLDGEMVATAGWAPADDGGVSARIRSVYVRPLFHGLGLGRHMTLQAESWARKSGFHSFGARVTLNSVGFFETLGYEVTSHGVQLLPANRGLPVSFMRKSDQHASQAIVSEEEAT